MVYLGIVLVICLIAIFCLKSKLDLGLLPLICLSVFLGSIVSSGYYTFRFFQEKENHYLVNDTSISTGKFSVSFGNLLDVPHVEIGNDYHIHLSNIDGENLIEYTVIQDTVTFLRAIDVEKRGDVGHICEISYNTREIRELHLDKKDYAVYKAFSDSVAKRN